LKDLTAKVYYGLHFCPGVAEYAGKLNEDGNPSRILINEQAAKQMDKSFQGKPVFVGHPNEVNVEEFGKRDGVVVESFFNKSDGFHWAKFVITSEEAQEKIAKGWRLSNAYFTTDKRGGGEWHGVPFDYEVTAGAYEHLAIVDNPRYEESVIYTPDEFKAYNEQREAELYKIANAKEKTTKKKGEGMLKFFKREVVENSKDFENTLVTLPESGIEMTITDLVHNADKAEMSKNEDAYCNGDEKVKIGDEEMSVNELMKKYKQMKKNMDDMENAKKNEEEEGKKDEKENEGKDGKKDAMENEEHDDKGGKSENAKGAGSDVGSGKSSTGTAEATEFGKLKNAEEKAAIENSKAGAEVIVRASSVELGKSRYGR